MEIYQIQMEELLDLELLVIKISVINKNIIKNLEIVFQTIRFPIVDRINAVDVSVYSNDLENILGWKAKVVQKYFKK